MPQLQKTTQEMRFLSASALKTIAICAMLIDHLSVALIAEYTSPLGVAMRVVGRITGPVMFYFIVEGYHHTRNANRYTLRLALFAALSYLPYIYFSTGGLPTAESWFTLNTIYTLTMGLLMLRAIHEIKNTVLSMLAVGVLFLLAMPGDWGYRALLYMLAFDMFRGSFAKQAGAYSLLTAAQMLSPVSSALKLVLAPGPVVEGISTYVASTAIQAGHFLPLLLLRFYNGARGSAPRWLFYVFYPAHLVVIGYIRWGLGWSLG